MVPALCLSREMKRLESFDRGWDILGNPDTGGCGERAENVLACAAEASYDTDRIASCIVSQKRPFDKCLEIAVDKFLYVRISIMADDERSKTPQIPGRARGKI